VKTYSFTHEELVDKAATWLSTIGCHAVVTEMNVAEIDCEIPDAIGWAHGHHSILIECKVSKSDFYGDQAKVFRNPPEAGMGYRRYYMAPKGLLTKEMVQKTGWGLLEATTHRVFITQPSPAFVKRNVRREMRMLVGALRRIQMRLTEPLHKAIKFNVLYFQKPLTLGEMPNDSELIYL